MIVSKKKIIEEYKQIKNNGIGFIRQVLFISKKLGADSEEVIRVIYESEK